MNNKLVSEAVESMMRQKEEYVIQEIKKLFATGAIWIEKGNMRVDEFYHKGYDTKINVSQNWRFVFDPMKRMEIMQEEIDRLKEIEFKYKGLCK